MNRINGKPAEHYQNMETRYAGYAQSLKFLEKDHSLSSFLSKATKYLESNEADATLVAHFLMGKTETLPDGLEIHRPELSPEVHEAMYDVLRTNRYGNWGIKESTEKTISKLTHLQALLEATNGPSAVHQINQASQTVPENTNRFLIKLSPEPTVSEKFLSLSASPVTENKSSLSLPSEPAANPHSDSKTHETTEAQLATQSTNSLQSSRKEKILEIISKAPSALTTHPGWKTVEQNMECYAEATNDIQGKIFDRLLETYGDQLFSLLETAKIQSTLGEKKAMQMATTRDLINIGMNYSDENTNNDSLGCDGSLARTGDTEVIEPGKQISICINTPIDCGNGDVKEISVLSCIAPALDTKKQPEFEKFVTGNTPSEYKLKHQNYQVSLETIKQQILEAARENKPPRVVLSAIGANAFLGALPRTEGEVARDMIANMLAETARELGAMGIEIGFTDVHNQFLDRINKINSNGPSIQLLGKIPGDWVRSRDLLLNAWDTHSLLGNGLSADSSLDGYIGRSSLIHFMHALICSMYHAGVIGDDGSPAPAAPPAPSIA
jgi:hypothetical protein